MIFTTLKANDENEVDYDYIAEYCDFNYLLVANFFENSDNYNNGGYTDFDKLYRDYTMREVANRCLKEMRTYAKDKNSPLMIYNKMFIDLDGDGEFAYEQLCGLIEDGIIGEGDIYEIDKISKKKGITIKKYHC